MINKQTTNNQQPTTNNQQPTTNKLLALAASLGLVLSSWGVRVVSAAPLLEQQGILSLEDNRLEDGRIYDAYNFQASAGEFVTIVVTSEQFDTYLLLLNSQDELVEENQNISYQNLNSSITIEIPATGKYRALVISNGGRRGGYNFQVREATRWEKEKLEADNLVDQGIEEYQNGQFQQAIRSWELASSLYNVVQDDFEDISPLQEGEETILGNIGLAYNQLGDYNKAISYQERSLQLAREIGNRGGEVVALNNLGLIYSSQGNYQQAIFYYQQSLTWKRELRDVAGEAKSLGSLGFAYFSLGNYQQAINYYEQSLTLIRQLNDSVAEGTSLSSLGSAYKALAQYEKAISYYEEGLAIKRKLGDSSGEVAILNYLGQVYFDKEDYNQAIDYYQQSLALARDIGDRRGEATALQNIGVARSYLGDYSGAVRSYDDSGLIFRELERWSK